MDEYFIDVTDAVFDEAVDVMGELQQPTMGDLEDGSSSFDYGNEETLSSSLIMKERLRLEIRNMFRGHLHGDVRELFAEDPLLVTMLAIGSSLAERLRNSIYESLGFVRLFLICLPPLLVPLYVCAGTRRVQVFVRPN